MTIAENDSLAEIERDAYRYRRFRALVEYGDFILADARDDEADPKAIDYGRELDVALDDRATAARGDTMIRIFADRDARTEGSNANG